MDGAANQPPFSVEKEVSMFIRLKFGSYAGEIRDIQAEAARELLNSDRAEDPYAPPVEVIHAATTQPVLQLSGELKRKRKETA